MPSLARYNTPVGANFETEWVREAKKVRRKDMTQLPHGLSIEDDWREEKLGKTLDLADWEQNIVMSSLRVVPVDSQARLTVAVMPLNRNERLIPLHRTTTFSTRATGSRM